LTPIYTNARYRVMNKTLKNLFLNFSSIFAVLLVLLFAQSSWSETFVGLLVVKPEGYFVATSNNKSELPLRPSTNEVKEQLLKLKTRDLIFGNGDLINGTWVVSSIDFVGLRDLIGLWSTKDAFVNFKDFSRVDFYINKPNNDKAPEKLNLTYSISPDIDGKWQIFFSSQSEVTLASLQFNSKTTASIMFYDSDTGQPSTQLDIKKISN
jgi:hypothetical protein